MGGRVGWACVQCTCLACARRMHMRVMEAEGRVPCSKSQTASRLANISMRLDDPAAHAGGWWAGGQSEGGRAGQQHTPRYNMESKEMLSGICTPANHGRRTLCDEGWAARKGMAGSMHGGEVTARSSGSELELGVKRGSSAAVRA